jgi:hypothetical protein
VGTQTTYPPGLYFVSVDEMWIFSSIHVASDVEPLTRTRPDRPALATLMIMKSGIAVASRIATRAAEPDRTSQDASRCPDTDRDAKPGILDPVPPS